MTFFLRTDSPVAADSLDHLHPFGTRQDNSRNINFNAKLAELCPPEANSVLDLGCSGGGMVHDLIDLGYQAVGLEGSDYSLKRGRAEWPLIPNNLFTCDITRPFVLSSLIGDMVSDPHVFDVVTAWELFEHIEMGIPLFTLMKNIERHTRAGSLLLCSIANFPSPHDGVELHRIQEGWEWWEGVFRAFGWRRDTEVERHFEGHWVRISTMNPALRRPE